MRYVLSSFNYNTVNTIISARTVFEGSSPLLVSDQVAVGVRFGFCRCNL